MPGQYLYPATLTARLKPRLRPVPQGREPGHRAVPDPGRARLPGHREQPAGQLAEPPRRAGRSQSRARPRAWPPCWAPVAGLLAHQGGPCPRPTGACWPCSAIRRPPCPAARAPCASLTGWTLASVNALLSRFFGSRPGPPGLGGDLRRVYDAYAMVPAAGCPPRCSSPRSPTPPRHDGQHPAVRSPCPVRRRRLATGSAHKRPGPRSSVTRSSPTSCSSWATPRGLTRPRDDHRRRGHRRRPAYCAAVPPAPRSRRA